MATARSIEGESIASIAVTGCGTSSSLRVIVGESYIGELLTINGQSYEGLALTRDELLRLIARTSLNSLELTHGKKCGIQPDLDAVEGSISSNSDRDENMSAEDRFIAHYVTLPSGVLGAQLERIQNADSRSPAALVGSYRVNSVTSSCTHLSEGDFVVAVNGVALMDLKPSNAARLFQQPERKLTIVQLIAAGTSPRTVPGALKGDITADRHGKRSRYVADMQSSPQSHKHEGQREIYPLATASPHDIHDQWTIMRSRLLHNTMNKDSALDSQQLHSAFNTSRHSLFREILSKYEPVVDLADPK